ncbi:MAG: HipA domain-containing protein, partial [Spirochaetia bacterium]|nr:HipA domain-containing protein [Spirochaetia bacterium]
ESGSKMFGMFLDSAPDRWGKLLMQRREQLFAKRDGRKPVVLNDLDFFLGVSDAVRMGALRYKLSIDGPFEAEETYLSCPPISDIRELQHSAWKFEENADNQELEKAAPWLHQLFAPGSSLGGARPKANICEKDGSVWIAKFPSRNDIFNIGAWEMTAHHLAERAGLRVPDARAERYSSSFHTYLVKRFDRNNAGSAGNAGNAGKRRHYASAITLLGYSDGMDHTAGASYLELAELIMKYGGDPDKDLKELWNRIAFSICISNTDDHLRNHGFILTPKGWRLSPVFDVNPNPGRGGLSLNVDENDNSLSVDLVKQVAPYFRVEPHIAAVRVDEIKHAVSHWRTYAEKYEIPFPEQELYQSAFIC